MALDTAAKRGSAMLLGVPWRGWVGVPSGTVDQAERQGVAWLGGSILAGAAAVLVRYAFRRLSAAHLTFSRLVGEHLGFVRKSGSHLDLARQP